ncbi:von Willebrand factor [Maioricimonas rarisocia]|uniref:von Willebrand factor n=1 Tax=Maioricimonas rarisocia TaxID=2528026 RepID=A0A517Z9J7_9PLAN|nr:VWA domain-containing protein [Maioricimonas rarisocia]QDU39162.1 von Willebrand factor [Maioricimonas rarisocia]
MRSLCAPITVCCLALTLLVVGCGQEAGDVAPSAEAPASGAANDEFATPEGLAESEESGLELRYAAPAVEMDESVIDGQPGNAVTLQQHAPAASRSVPAGERVERSMEEADSFSMETYDRIVENAFRTVMDHPLSTFSIDVDTASYSNVRRYLNNGQLPPPGAVRIEELVNYFPYDYPAPNGDVPFAVNAEIAGCPWEPRHRLVRFGLKGKVIEADQRPPSNLVFLLDVSGSMQNTNKLPLVKQAMQLLVERLDENDTVAIAVYAGSSGLVLPPTPASRKHVILSAMERLRAGGSTNGGQGIELAYSTAMSDFIEGGTNRVILCTDGDFNIGVTDQSQLVRMIEEKAKSGVFLSVLGFGMGNYKDSTMEKLADHGNGNYAYIDTFAEARKVLVEQLTGTLVTIAKDVKIQVEFNPAQVAAYRLVGYENRMLAKEDFNDDTKDAGEIGAGHTVTALYEIVPRGVESPALANVDPLKYQQPTGLSTEAMSTEVLTLKLRYKEPDGQTSRKLEFPIRESDATFATASREFQFASAVAAFGMLLRQSEHKGVATYAAVEEWATPAIEADAEGYREEFLRLVRIAAGLAGSS